MAQTRKRRRYSRDEINTLLERFDASGLSQVAFSRHEGLSLSTLRWWLDRRRRQRIADSRFVPVAITEAAVAHEPRLEIELTGERRVHIPADIDPEALRALLPIVIEAC